MGVALTLTGLPASTLLGFASLAALLVHRSRRNLFSSILGAALIELAVFDVFVLPLALGGPGRTWHGELSG